MVAIKIVVFCTIMPVCLYMHACLHACALHAYMLQVSEGMWAGEEPATENVEIIHYLDAVRPVTTEEAYLSDQFNVSTLFTELADVEGAKDSVVTIATILRDQEMLTQDAAKSLKEFREVMSSI